jgi:DNA gyrase/topoisomerase IV subunit A
MTESRYLKNVINNEFKDYCFYTIHNRAIPSMIDGLKPSQRKIIFTAYTKCSTNYIKTASLSGAVIEYANFHHGNASLDDAISKLAAPFSNNVPFLTGNGSFGSRLVQEYASPRYTFVKLSDSFKHIFKDSEILEYSSDPEEPEPLYYLPVIPTILLNGITGIATGFACNILPRSLKDLKKLCRKYCKNQKISNKDLVPTFPDFSGSVVKSGMKWICEGIFNWKSKTQIEITELPIGFDREKYIEVLEKLKDENKIINYQDDCASHFHFIIKLKNSSQWTDEIIKKEFQLQKSLTENLTVIDQYNQLKIFNNAIELIKEFCDFRLKKYTERLNYYIKRDEEKLKLVLLKKEFIIAIMQNEINLQKSSQKDMEQWIQQNLTLDSNIISHLLNIPIFKISKDSLDSLTQKIQELEKNLDIWKNKDNAEAFLEDLDAI